MDKKNLKKYLKIIGINRYSQLKKGSLDKYWNLQCYKILNSAAEEQRKNDLLERLNKAKKILSNFSEQEIISLLKEGEEQSNTFERENVSSNYQDRASNRPNTGFNTIIGRIPKELTFDEWIENIVGFKINGCLMFLIFLFLIPTPIGWFLLIWWLLRRER